MLTHILAHTALLGALWSASLTIYLFALRFIAWDLVPASALPHIHWWQRHARPILWATLTLTTAALLGLVILR
jgi:hypothetical protein